MFYLGSSIVYNVIMREVVANAVATTSYLNVYNLLLVYIYMYTLCRMYIAECVL